ncbi:MAG: Cystathionine gamma-lyase, partial [uncultured Corynebacteriales bacterium]
DVRVRDARHPRRAGARPEHRVGDDPHPPDLDLQAGRGRRPAGRLRVQPVGEPDPDRAAGVPGRAGERGARARLRLRAGRRGHPAADRAGAGRPRGHPGRRVRRLVPAVRHGAGALGRGVHAGAPGRPGRRPGGGHPGHQAAVVRDAHQPAARHRRHRRAGRDRPGRRRAAGGRQHLRLAVPAAAADARGGRGRALDHEVPRRALRRGRRRAGAQRPGAGPAAGLPPERDGLRAGAVRLVAGAARGQDARGPDGPALRERGPGGRDAAGPPEGRRRLLPGPARAPGARGGREADARLRRHGVLHADRRRAGGAAGVRADRAVHPGRVAGRDRVADRAPGPDDPRVGERVPAGGAGRPGPALGRDRVGRGPADRPADRAEL